MCKRAQRKTSGQSTEQAAREEKRPLLVADLFCGAGGLSFGLACAGIEIAAAYDHSPKAVAIYNANVVPVAEVAELKRDLYATASRLRLLGVNMLVAGSPCQDYSTAGLRIEGERADLVYVLSMHAQHLRPRWILFENVANAGNAVTWSALRRSLSETGYGLTELVLDCSFYGVPQKRKRLFLIGCLGEKDGFLEAPIRAAASAKPMTMRDLFGGKNLPPWVYRHPRNLDRRSVYSPDDSHPTVRQAIRSAPKPPGKEDRRLLSQENFFVPGYENARSVFRIDGQCPTVTKKSGEGRGPRHQRRQHPSDPVPPWEAAVLSRDQIARVQGFPVWWNWSGLTLTEQAEQVANAVPAPVAEVLGEIIIAYDAGLIRPQVPDGFRSWLLRGGLTAASVNNIIYRIHSAWELLGNRTYRHHNDEIAALEALSDFQAKSVSERSNIRCALRRLAEWERLSPPQRKVGYQSRRCRN